MGRTELRCALQGALAGGNAGRPVVAAAGLEGQGVFAGGGEVQGQCRPPGVATRGQDPADHLLRQRVDEGRGVVGFAAQFELLLAARTRQPGTDVDLVGIILGLAGGEQDQDRRQAVGAGRQLRLAEQGHFRQQGQFPGQPGIEQGRGPAVACSAGVVELDQGNGYRRRRRRCGGTFAAEPDTRAYQDGEPQQAGRGSQPWAAPGGSPRGAGSRQDGGGRGVRERREGR